MAGITNFSFVAGEVPTVSVWNTLPQNDAILASGAGITALNLGTTNVTNPYKFSVYQNASGLGRQTTPLVFDTKLYDTGSNYSTSTGRFTAPVAGFYWFSSTITSTNAANTGFGIALYKNGSEIKGGTQFVSTYTTGPQQIGNNVSGMLQLAVGDYITVQDPYAPSIACYAGSQNTFFDGFFLSSA